MTVSQETLLLIGPQLRKSDVVGGTKISFQILVSFFSQLPEWKVIVIDSSRSAGKSRIGRLTRNLRSWFRSLWQLLKAIRRASVVMLNASPRGLMLLGPPVFWLSRFAGKPVVVRVFGGDFDRVLAEASPVMRALSRKSYLNADTVFFQTRRLTESFRDESVCQWLPTSRIAIASPIVRQACKRILFVAQLRPEKGIREALRASEEFAMGTQLTIFGAQMPGFDVTEIDAFSAASYRGERPHEVVLEALESHDLLLLPTYWEGEGYPGVVIEALQHGLPVVASRWKDLEELIEHEVNGLLIEPRSEHAIVEAIQQLQSDPALFKRMSAAAIKSGEPFSSQAVNGQLNETLHYLVYSRGAD
jgi:glycosyltransferase involved in cell wall biosynthesis